MKLDYPNLKNTTEKLAARYKPMFILIEDKASGQSLIQDIKRTCPYRIIPQKPKLDKITRFASVVPMFQNGTVILPKSASWMQSFLSEITKFPNSKHDDIIDSISQFLCFMKEQKQKTVRIREV